MSRLNYGWRIVIHTSRYSGAYEGGAWFAMFLDDSFPEDAIGDDVECATYFGDYIDIIGVGNTPQDALDNLIEKNKTAADFYNNYVYRKKAGRPWASKLRRYAGRYFTREFPLRTGFQRK